MTSLSLTRKISILAYLADHMPTVTELAEHFNTTPAQMRQEMNSLYTTEYPDGTFYVAPVDVVLPDSDAEPVILMENATHMDLGLTLGEVISLLALIDDMHRSVDAPTRRHLAQLRERIVKTAVDAGYGEALWPSPTVNLSEGVADTLAAAIEARRFIELEYLKMGPDLQIANQRDVVAPVSITTGSHPLLVAGKGTRGQDTGGQDAGNGRLVLRTYRLDRIAQVELRDERYTRKIERDIRDQYAAQDQFTGHLVTVVCTAQARWVAETIPVNSVRETGDVLEIEFVASSIPWLRTLLIRLGDTVIDVEPPEVRDQLAQEARDYLQEH